MSQVEVPRLLHSEEERATMLTRMQEIADRDEISAEELEEVGYLILDREVTEYDKEYGLYDYEMGLPDADGRVVIKIGPANKRDNYFDIVFLDGITNYSGEMVKLDRDDRGGSRWRIGTINSIYSEFLGRRIGADTAGYVLATESLTSREQATLAKKLVDTYISGQIS